MENIHQVARRGDLVGLNELLGTTEDRRVLVNAVDESGYTPLYYAVSASGPSVELATLLLDAGADPGFVKVERFEGLPADWKERLGELGDEPEDDETEDEIEDGEIEESDDLSETVTEEFRESLLAAALKAGHLPILQLLHRYGADFGYHEENGYTAILHAVYGVEERLPVIRYLVGLGLDVRGASSYGETALRTASGFGQFQVVAELLRAGADEDQLGWTLLHRAVALGTREDVVRELEGPVDLRAYDHGGRTALHIALRKGDGELVDLLLASGTELSVASEDGMASIGFAVEGGHHALVARILAMGCAPEDRDAALHVAVERGRHEVARVLLDGGADANHPGEIYTPLEDAPDQKMVLLLLEYGADPAGLDNAGRRKLLGLPERDDDALSRVTREEYLVHRYSREGKANPEEISDPFRLGMIRAGWMAYHARRRFDDPATFACGVEGHREPAVWCFDRFGQSTTILPDGRIVLIAGEHEDFYDPDFCIFNDVTVFDPDGEIRVYGYSHAVFPPTDFHTATLAGSSIYIVGCLGYVESRESEVPVRRLDTTEFQIEPVMTSGEGPGRIFNHRATLVSEHTLRIEGGTRITFEGSEEVQLPNADTFELDLLTLAWSKVSPTPDS